MNENYFYTTEEVINIMHALENLNIIHKNRSKFKSKRTLKTAILTHLLNFEKVKNES